MGRGRRVFVVKKTKALSYFEGMGHTIVSKLKELLKEVCAHSGDLIRETDKIAFIIKDGQLALVKFRALTAAKDRRQLLEKNDIEDWLRAETRSSTAGSRKSQATMRRGQGVLPPQVLVHG